MFAEVFLKNCAPGLTRKAVYGRLCPVMKRTTLKRIAQALLALALLALVIAQGLLEVNPNH
jgi:hypothetical protein